MIELANWVLSQEDLIWENPTVCACACSILSGLKVVESQELVRNAFGRNCVATDR